MSSFILKNPSGSPVTLTGFSPPLIIPPSGQIDLSSQNFSDEHKFSVSVKDDLQIRSGLLTGTLILNNGTVDIIDFELIAQYIQDFLWKEMPHHQSRRLVDREDNSVAVGQYANLMISLLHGFNGIDWSRLKVDPTTGGLVTTPSAGSDTNNPLIFDWEEVSATVIHFGKAAPGSLRSDAAWRIIEYDLTTFPITKRFAGDAGFTQVMNDHATLIYS